MKTNRIIPSWLSNNMWDIATNHHMRKLPICEYKILEPSAGEGNLIKLSWNSEFLFENSEITVVELNKEKCDKLKKHSKKLNVIHANFLNYDFTDKFHVIIAAPPFNNNIDVEHIKKMYTLLDEYGIIVTLTSPYWMTNNEPHQVQFREWLKDKDHKFEMLPDMTFIEKGKTVPTGILILKK